MTQGRPPFVNPPQGPGTGEWIALGAAIGWIVLGGLVWWLLPGVVGPVGLILPFLLLTAAFLQARQLRLMRDEAKTLRSELATMRREKAQPSPGESASLASLVQPIATAPAPAPQLRHRSHIADGPAPTFASRRDPDLAKAAPQADDQGQLIFDTAPPPPPPLSNADLLSALNFPQDPDDTDGFRALRMALRHPGTAPLVQAAQDVLTLLSQIGLYMDDLTPDRARPEVWRRFASGERSGATTELGGIRDEAALTLCAKSLREDPVFRDAAHHFLRRFDLTLGEHIGSLDDTEVIRLADGRSARAFMLLGRTMGIFD